MRAKNKEILKYYTKYFNKRTVLHAMSIQRPLNFCFVNCRIKFFLKVAAWHYSFCKQRFNGKFLIYLALCWQVQKGLGFLILF